MWSGSCVVLLLAVSAIAEPDTSDAVSAFMDGNGSRFTVTAPGAMAFLSSFSATIVLDGQPRVLSSIAGGASALTNCFTEATPYGAADIVATTIRFQDEGVDLLFRLGRVSGVSGVMAQAGVRNSGKKPFQLLTVTPVSLAGQLVGNPSQWLITALDGSGLSADKTVPVVSLSDIVAPLSIHECGGMYRKDGAGLFFGPVGRPTAYVDASFTPRHDGKMLLNLRSDMSSASVDPGETRWGQQVVMLMEPPSVALAHWVDWVARTHGARTSKGALSGWSAGSVTQTVPKVMQAGLPSLKICDITSVATPPVDDEKRTAFERCRDDFEAIRKAAGEDAYLLCCDKAPNRAAVGIVDASRISSDASPGDLSAAIRDVLRSYQLQGRWFAVDSDLGYMEAQLAKIGEASRGLPIVRTWMSIVGLSCGAASSAVPGCRDGSKHLRDLDVMTPPAKERTDVLDLLIEPYWSRLVGNVARDWGGWTVALLWNPAATEGTVRLDFAEAGLNPKRHYAVWSFWDNRYLGVASGSWTTPSLPPLGSQHLCFTDLDRSPNRPVLIGSNLHIYCGAAEIKRVSSLSDAIAIELTDAGADDGDLFVYSRQPPMLKEASGCTVKNIVGAGENVWQISVANRQRGVPQSIELGILLPFTRQAWFWLLIAAACVSLLFAAWRYMAGLRLQREHALAEERTRIARDLHDDLGGELSSIAMLSDLTQHHVESEVVRGRLREMSLHARDTVRRLEEIVWAINPANDSIEQFAGYFCKVAQAYLEVAGVRSRFDVPDQFEPRPLTSMQRHNLFLAAKEALHNAVRHGNPTEVRIRILLEDESLVVVVEDNGKGFDATPGPPAGHGSANMEARMKGIGGKFERCSTPGQGTVVTLSAPLKGPIA